MTDCVRCNGEGCSACTLSSGVKFGRLTTPEDIKTEKILLPDYSRWTLYLYGSKPGSYWTTQMRIIKGNVPNFFVRWMMKSIGCTWVKEVKA